MSDMAYETLISQKAMIFGSASSEKAEQGSCGTGAFAERPVFTNGKGGYMNAGYLNNSFRKYCTTIGLPAFHIHDLRHAAASLLINNGVPVKIVSELLGHQDTRVTEQIYTHIYSNTLNITAEMMNKLLTDDKAV